MTYSHIFALIRVLCCMWWPDGSFVHALQVPEDYVCLLGDLLRMITASTTVAVEYCAYFSIAIALRYAQDQYKQSIPPCNHLPSFLAPRHRCDSVLHKFRP